MAQEKKPRPLFALNQRQDDQVVEGQREGQEGGGVQHEGGERRGS